MVGSCLRPDRARRRQLGHGRAADLAERRGDPAADEADELGGVRRRIAGIAFGLHVDDLRLGQRLAARVGEQAIEGAGEVSGVEADRGGAARRRPNLVDGQRGQRRFDILLRLQERVDDGLQLGRSSPRRLRGATLRAGKTCSCEQSIAARRGSAGEANPRRPRAGSGSRALTSTVPTGCSRRREQARHQPALVHRRTALPVHRHQLHRSPDAQRPGAVPEDRIHLDQHRLRLADHRLPRRLFDRADGGRQVAGSGRHANRPVDRRAVVLRRRHADLARRSGLKSFAVFRFLLGAGEAANWPGATKAVSEWFPRRESGWAVALFDSGSSIGAAIASVLVVWLYLTFGTWRPVFVITGSLGLIWLWLFRRAYHTPETHPAISAEERAYILADREPLDPDGRRPAGADRSAARAATDVGHHHRQDADRSGVVPDHRLVRHLPGRARLQHGDAACSGSGCRSLPRMPATSSPAASRAA